MDRTRRWLLTLAASALAGTAVAAPSPASLRDTGLFVDGSVDQVRPDVVAFAPQYPLWSDGAAKRRWIHLPPGTSVNASRPFDWRFPVGTRLWKEFRFDGRRVETRMLDRTADGWRFSTYVWNAAGTDAALAPAEGTAVTVPGRAPIAIPSEGDCRSCHEGRETPVLGFTALQLSPDRDPLAAHAEAPPADAADLRALVARGLVRGLPPALLARPPRIAAATPTARAALGYLAGNCAHCHNELGPLAGLEMTLDPGAPAGAAAVLASLLARPSRFVPAGATDAVRVAPGRPELSVVFARMRARDALTQMPPLGSRVVDQEGLALVERWIREQGPAAVPPSPKPEPSKEKTP